VLAILAEKCGAKSVLAIDNDEWSIRNATENIALNDAGIITLKKEFTRGMGVFDVILANINKMYCSKSTRLQQHLASQAFNSEWFFAAGSERFEEGG